MTYIIDNKQLIALSYMPADSMEDISESVLMLPESTRVYLPSRGFDAYVVDDVKTIIDWMQHEAESNGYDFEWAVIEGMLEGNARKKCGRVYCHNARTGKLDGSFELVWNGLNIIAVHSESYEEETEMEAATYQEAVNKCYAAYHCNYWTFEPYGEFEEAEPETLYIAKQEYIDVVYGREGVACMTREEVEQLVLLFWHADPTQDINGLFGMFREATHAEIEEYGVG